MSHPVDRGAATTTTPSGDRPRWCRTDAAQQVTPTSSKSMDAEARRRLARSQLSAQLRDRGLSGMQRSKTQTEMPLGAEGALGKGKNGMMRQGGLVMMREQSRLERSDEVTRKHVRGGIQQSGAGWSRHVTLSELNRILQNAPLKNGVVRTQNQNGLYTVCIGDLSSGDYPNIKLTVSQPNENRHSPAGHVIAGGSPDGEPVEGRVCGRPRAAMGVSRPPRTPCRYKLLQDKFVDIPLVKNGSEAREFLASLEKNRLNSAERIQRWLVSNPVGEEGLAETPVPWGMSHDASSSDTVSSQSHNSLVDTQLSHDKENMASSPYNLSPSKSPTYSNGKHVRFSQKVNTQKNVR